MIRYAARSLRAQLGAGRLLFALTVLGVALGIASVLSIQILNRSALAAFRGSVQAVSGDADLSVLPRTPVLPESLFVRVLADRDVAQAWPLYQVNVAVAGRERFYLEVVGSDLYAAAAGLPFTGGDGDPGDALGVRGWAAVTPALAAELGLARGDSLPVTSGSRAVRLVVGALVDFQRVTPLASRKLVVMDIAQAQALLGERGALTQIDVRLQAGADQAAAAARLNAALGPTVEVLNPEQRERRAEGLMRAFRLNLTALSLINLVVGFFLVHSTTQAALVRRRTEFGVLRASGATRAQVFGLVLGEVSLLGLLGVAIGIPLGVLAARANVDVVSGTISNLYMLSEIERLDVPTWLYALAVALGLAGAVTGAVGPARDLARTEVRDLLASFTLHERTATHTTLGLMLAAALLAACAAAFALFATVPAWGQRWPWAGFAIAVALLLAMPLGTPWLVRSAAGRVRLRGFGVGFALRSLASRLQTTSFAVASLAIAVAMLVGITVMVASFRDTVTLWIGGTLQADVYITTPSWRGTGMQGTLDDELVAALARRPGVAAVDRLRGFPAFTGGRRIALAGVDFALPDGEARVPLLAGDVTEAFRAVRADGAVIISEPLARKTGLGVGDSIPLTTAAGERRFAIAGVAYDYSSENGAVTMDLVTLAAAFGPGPLNSIAIYLAPGQDAERWIDGVRADLGARPLHLRSNRSLRAEVMRIFDQTFAVTRLLQVMALLVAATGITLTLLILARERLSELALCRALGAGRRQLFGYFLGKGVAIGAFGLALGGAGGAALAAVLIYVINRAWFGWTIQVVWPGGQLAGAAATIVLAAAVASIYPALLVSRTSAGQLSRDDL